MRPGKVKGSLLLREIPGEQLYPVVVLLMQDWESERVELLGSATRGPTSSFAAVSFGDTLIMLILDDTQTPYMAIPVRIGLVDDA